MKKIYIIFITLFIIGVGSGIYYFTNYKQSKMYFPKDIVMETQKGGTYNFGKMEKKVRLLEFVYLDCPDLCPNTTLQMEQIRNKLVKDGVFGSKVEFLTITFNPERDTMERLNQYAKTFHINKTNGWELLRGSVKDTKRLTNQFDFLFRDSGTNTFVHTTATYLLDEQNHVVKLFGMGKYDFDQEKVYKAIKSEIN